MKRELMKLKLTDFDKAVKSIHDDKPLTKDIGLPISLELHKRAKLFCIENKISLKDLVSAALESYIDK